MAGIATGGQIEAKDYWIARIRPGGGGEVSFRFTLRFYEK